MYSSLLGSTPPTLASLPRAKMCTHCQYVEDSSVHGPERPGQGPAGRCPWLTSEVIVIELTPSTVQWRLLVKGHYHSPEM